jgi:CheY-like chemotaxis protein
VPKPTTSSNGRILVVDDDADQRDFLRLALEELGYDILEASNGQEALDSLATETVSVMLLDLNMPGMRGDEVIERLPSHPPRVVILTSAAVEDVGGMLRRGPHYYLPKGATREELSLLLQSLDA